MSLQKLVRWIIAILAFFLGCGFAGTTDQKAPMFYFGGKGLSVGMPKAEAAALLSEQSTGTVRPTVINR